MKHVIFLIVVLSLIACNTKNTNANLGDLDLTGFETSKLPGTSTTFVFKKDAKGNMLEEGYIANGQKEGQWISYDKDRGTISSISSYVNGKLNGYSFIVSNKGYLDEQIGYLNGELHGNYFKFRYGRPQYEAHYKDGKLNGLKKEYYDSGKLQQETEFKDGVQNGIYKFYNEEGVLILDYIYKNGEKVEGGMVEEPSAEQ